MKWPDPLMSTLAKKKVITQNPNAFDPEGHYSLNFMTLTDNIVKVLDYKGQVSKTEKGKTSELN